MLHRSTLLFFFPSLIFAACSSGVFAVKAARPLVFIRVSREIAQNFKVIFFFFPYVFRFASLPFVRSRDAAYDFALARLR